MKILVLAAGSIAIKKLNEFINILEQNHHEVKVVYTQNAKKILHFLDLETRNEQQYFNDLSVAHIDLAKEADLILIYPCTFNLLSKIANGIADDLASSILSLGFFNKLGICLAMNSNMYNNPINQANIKKLKELNVKFFGPEEGLLYCKDYGIGKIISPIDLYKEIKSQYIQKIPSARFLEPRKKLLISIGYTVSYLDEFRSIGVRVSGKTGMALINALNDRYDITVINGNLSHINEKLGGVKKVYNIKTNSEYEQVLFDEIKKHQIFISNIAITDFDFEKHEGKYKKHEQINFKYEIAKDYVKEAKELNPSAFVVAFALEMQNPIINALKKFEAKKVDLLVLNYQMALGNSKTSGVIFERNYQEEFNDIKKEELALLVKQKIDLIH